MELAMSRDEHDQYELKTEEGRKILLCKRILEDNLNTRYPETEENVPEQDRMGTIPGRVADVMEHTLDHRRKQSALFDKNATPAEGSKSIETAMETARPYAIIEERSSKALAEASAQRKHTFSKYSDLHVRTGHSFVDQWRPEYTAMAHPMSLTYRVGGPEYKSIDRGRRTGSFEYMEGNKKRKLYPAVVDPRDFAQGLARRIEGQMRQDWGLVPAVRNVSMRHEAITGTRMAVKQPMEPGIPIESLGRGLVRAASPLYTMLWKGSYKVGSKQRRVAGDITKLRFAENLTTMQRTLLRGVDFIGATLPGTQQVRLKTGHCVFGARLVDGDCLFFTIPKRETFRTFITSV